ncbi:hypothetical protein Zmor_007970 [Zophobas morio]|uniref:Uncharacterized protein n=1 Tax=Zophobas morio TaxID=2755281 RepID=A0AA38MQB1_9CUCU|nr:hypothetical protein Zmor_007970 [Zophobas morio]
MVNLRKKTIKQLKLELNDFKFVPMFSSALGPQTSRSALDPDSGFVWSVTASFAPIRRVQGANGALGNVRDSDDLFLAVVWETDGGNASFSWGKTEAFSRFRVDDL